MKQDKETGLQVLFSTLYTFGNLVAALGAIFIVVALVTGTPPEHNTPWDYPVQDN